MEHPPVKSVILSAAGNSRSEVPAESKDPYSIVTMECEAFLRCCSAFSRQSSTHRRVMAVETRLAASPATSKAHQYSSFYAVGPSLLRPNFSSAATVRKESPMNLDKQLLKSLPKVLLHEHLDGVLRPQSVIELAKEVGYSDLPTDDSQALAQWFFRGANQGSLAKYLEGFAHTIAVMQTEEALERVAYEQAEDLSKDGVVYFETRFAPLFHTQKGLTHQQVVSAVLKGLERGRKDFGIASGLIICAMRNMDVSLEMAELAVDFRARGVVGFDLAGEEGGYPPKKHVAAFHYIQRENFNITIHAGEGYGKESIWQAIQYCGAHRIGHGTRLIDDIAVIDGKAVKLGDLAQYVLDKRIPLEICLISNVHTGATPSLAEHPFKILYQEKFRVTLNTDNRLMSSTSMTQEFEAAADTFGLTMDDFEKITINAMKSAFLPYKERCNFIYTVIKPGYARIRKSANLPAYSRQ
jgi:adenosine deaminase